MIDLTPAIDNKRNTNKQYFYWFHVFKAWIDDGHLADLQGSSVKVYLVIKSHANYQSGFGYPEIDTIAQKTGLSQSQTKRAAVSSALSGTLFTRHSYLHVAESGYTLIAAKVASLRGGLQAYVVDTAEAFESEVASVLTDDLIRVASR